MFYSTGLFVRVVWLATRLSRNRNRCGFSDIIHRFFVLAAHIDLNAKPPLEAALNIATWVIKNRVEILNVTGPRASKDPGIYDAVSDVLESAIHLISIEKFQPLYKKPEDRSDFDIIDAILGEMPLQEKSGIANMNKDQMAILQQAFEMYIRSKTGSDCDDEEYNEIMLQLWERLQESHRIRVV